MQDIVLILTVLASRAFIFFVDYSQMMLEHVIEHRVNIIRGMNPFEVIFGTCESTTS